MQLRRLRSAERCARSTTATTRREHTTTARDHKQQRATCSVEMSALSETRKWSTTPTNLLDLSRLSVAGADDGASKLETNPERERCMRTARSWLTGSLFFVRKPVTE